jgi:hypothetical protein
LVWCAGRDGVLFYWKLFNTWNILNDQTRANSEDPTESNQTQCSPLAQSEALYGPTAPLVLTQALSLHTYFTHFLPTGRLAVQNKRGSSFPKFTGPLQRQRWCNWQLRSCLAASLPRVPWSEWQSRSQMEVLTAAGRTCVAQQLLQGICKETNGFTLFTKSSWSVYGPFLTTSLQAVQRIVSKRDYQVNTGTYVIVRIGRPSSSPR